MNYIKHYNFKIRCLNYCHRSYWSLSKMWWSASASESLSASCNLASSSSGLWSSSSLSITLWRSKTSVLIPRPPLPRIMSRSRLMVYSITRSPTHLRPPTRLTSRSAHCPCSHKPRCVRRSGASSWIAPSRRGSRWMRTSRARWTRRRSSGASSACATRSRTSSRPRRSAGAWSCRQSQSASRDRRSSTQRERGSLRSILLKVLSKQRSLKVRVNPLESSKRPVVSASPSREFQAQ